MRCILKVTSCDSNSPGENVVYESELNVADLSDENGGRCLVQSCSVEVHDRSDRQHESRNELRNSVLDFNAAESDGKSGRAERNETGGRNFGYLDEVARAISNASDMSLRKGKMLFLQMIMYIPGKIMMPKHCDKRV